jgi:hypothetical protein
MLRFFVSRYDGHVLLANSAALRRARITARTPDPPGGVIVRDAQGNPTGALKDAAMNLAAKAIPPLSHDRAAYGTARHAACVVAGRDQRAKHESRLCRPNCSSAET